MEVAKTLSLNEKKKMKFFLPHILSLPLLFFFVQLMWFLKCDCVFHFNFVCVVFAVEPHGKELQRCLESKERLWSNPPKFIKTIADAIRTQQVCELYCPFLCVCLLECFILLLATKSLVFQMKPSVHLAV